MALRGIKVLELAGLAPAPFCGMVLGDFGASVLRVDKVHDSNEMDILGNGKKSVALNLKHPKGIEIFRKLCRQSDVLIEPFRCRVMESLGLGPDILLEENPRLIYARLSGYGHSGSYSSRAGHDINYVAMSGLLSMFGRYNDKPTFPLNLVADFGGGGLMCALGILLALFEREKSGLGQVVDNSMVDGSAYLGSWIYRSQQLPLWSQERGKNILDTGSHFYDVYETKDGKYLAVGAIEPQFYLKLLEGLNLSIDELPQWQNFEENKELLSIKFKEKSQDEWMQIFEDTDACVTPVLTIKEAPNHKHNADRKTFSKAHDTIAPNPAPKLSRTPAPSRSSESCPQVGEHTTVILRSLNYSDKEITEFERNGIISCIKHAKL